MRGLTEQDILFILQDICSVCDFCAKVFFFFLLSEKVVVKAL